MKISTTFATILATLIVCAIFAVSFFAVYTVIAGICAVCDKMLPDGILLVSFFLALGVTIVACFSFYCENN